MKTLAMMCSFGVGILGLASTLESKVFQAPISALQATGVSKDDLRKLLAAKISDATIIAYIRSHAPAEKLSAEDVIDLRNAGATGEVLAAMVEASSGKASPAPSAQDAAPSYSYSSSAPYGTSSYDYNDGYSNYGYYPYYGYYGYYPYYYSYPYYPYYGLGFGLSFAFHDHHHDDHFHHFDNHAGHFGVHGGQVPHGTFHGGTGSGGGGHGGGGHGGGGHGGGGHH